MKDSEKIYQIKTIGFENGKKVEKAVCINDDEFLRKDNKKGNYQ